MAADPASTDTPAADFEAHARDYSGFTRMFKYGAIAAFIIAMLVIQIIRK